MGWGSRRVSRQWISYAPGEDLLRASVKVTKQMQRMAMPTADRVAVKRMESPGRLNTRNVVAAASLRQQGNHVAAMKLPPFRAHKILRTNKPPGVVGIMADVSASMSWSTTAVGEAAWLLARGAAHSGATVASVSFGEVVDPIVFPGEVPHDILIRSASDYAHCPDRALAALDGALDLSRATHAGVPRSRIVVILSDLQWGDERKPFTARARRLAMSGVRFITIGIPARALHDGTVVDTNIEADLIAALGIDVPPWEREHKSPTTRFINPGRAATPAEMRMLRAADQRALIPMRAVCRDAVWDYRTDTGQTRDRIVGEVLSTLREMSGLHPQKS
jgi:hypothetical protein